MPNHIEAGSNVGRDLSRFQSASETASRHKAYERRKQAWMRKNPCAPQDEYEREMHRLAEECGV